MGAFSESVRLFADKTNQRMDQVVRAFGMKILGRLITLSPVGDPSRWKVNAELSKSKARASRINAMRRKDPRRVTKTGRLKRGQKVHAGVRREFKTRNGKTVAFIQRREVGRGYTGGRFRGNWQVSFNAPIDTAIDRIDKSGGATLAAGDAVLAGLNLDQVHSVWFCNNVPYARRLEFGWSNQAPNGIVRITAAEARRYIAQAIGESKQ
ncbi:hypothetical protein O197_49 [Edwardsiella phage eiAU-183]|uniref:Gp12 n=3 Tax=Viruses TaxID=10239 RepID=W0LN07_9CAUD|nr:tail completion or Neck1 protein [Edwardsiella phage eiAU-183]YP_009613899.1 tail completion or Neck1 protein [Edwardsiella phage eiAU]ADV36475.1 gp12 [Edwardsiella phage eiDWF]AHG23465.1 hypothetical protein P858_49 [Edwardsiella phage eiAU]AHG23519.1 hypothetical protein O197_49 [Edwardsiella phage eiAU-183]